LLQLIGQDRIANLVPQSIDRLLETPDSVIQRHGKDPVHERSGAERLSQEDIQKARHNCCRIGDSNNVLHD